MLDYQKPDRGWCGDRTRGAAMGRPDTLPEDTTGPLHVRRVPLDGDYDPGGTYWGGGPGTLPLFLVWNDEGEVAYRRASSIEAVRERFPGATWAPETGPSESDLNDMLVAYIVAALWSTNDESDESGGEPFDSNYGPEDLADEARASMKADVDAFALANAETIVRCVGKGRCDWSQAGHDLWLTRNGHGCGFGDGDWPEAEGEALTEAAKKMGETGLYLGDDGKIYAGF